MAEAQQISEPEESGADDSKEKSLPELLGEWDEHKRPASEPEGLSADDFAYNSKNEFEDKIRALESDLSDLTERAEQAEGMGEIFDRAMTHIDQRDFDELAKKLAAETGMNKRAANFEIEKKYREDEDFAAAADDRLDDPEGFAEKVVHMIHDLQETYPQPVDDHGLVVAVLNSRSARGVSYGAGDWPDLSKLNTAEFEVVSRQIFEAAETGKLRSNRPRGGCLRTRPSG